MSILFFFKKLIAFFLEPLGIVLSLLAIGLYLLYRNRVKKAKLFLLLGVVSLFLFSYPPFANMLVQNLENNYPKYDYKTEVKYIHVLGNGHNTDKSQPISSNLNATQTKRVLEGVIIHRETPGSQLVFTGYAGSTDMPNAKMSSILAKALGVDDRFMLINNRPTDTQEEAEYMRSVVGEQPFVLVTSASHMPRAMMLFSSLGMNPIAAPTNFYKDEFRGFLRAPDVRSFFISTVALHEYFGMVLAKVKGLFS